MTNATSSAAESVRVGVIGGHLRVAGAGLGAILNQAGASWDALLTLAAEGVGADGDATTTVPRSRVGTMGGGSGVTDDDTSSLSRSTPPAVPDDPEVAMP